MFVFEIVIKYVYIFVFLNKTFLQCVDALLCHINIIIIIIIFAQDKDTKNHIIYVFYLPPSHLRKTYILK